MTEKDSSSDSTGETRDSSASSEEFPVAKVRSANGGSLLRQSRMWWITLICMLMAVWLAWQSLPEEGPTIVIQFPEGHGLKEGDAVRYRGIEVGTVSSVRLNDGLSSVEARVILQPEAEDIRRKGSRFWIVRPQLSLTEIRGLETAVGAKYIGVSPGPVTDPINDRFDGLPAAPPDELGENGLELILQADDLHGITVGAPVRWRGVEVGRVLSFGLSPDARQVNVSVRIDGDRRRLVRPDSKFWVTSGFDVDLGLRGLKLNAESLATIARGGISFITPDAGEDDAEVKNGDVFPLFGKVQDDWIESAAGAPLIPFSLPETVVITGKRPSSFLGISRMKSYEQTGVLVGDGSSLRLFTAALPTGDETSEQLAEFRIRAVGSETVSVSEDTAATFKSTQHGVMVVSLTETALTGQALQVHNTLPNEPTDVVIVRSAFDGNDAVPLMQTISRSELTSAEAGWQISSKEHDLSEWHGAPVLTADSGEIVGVLVIGDAGPVIAATAE